MAFILTVIAHHTAILLVVHPLKVEIQLTLTFWGIIMSKIGILKNFCKNFPYVFSVRTLYSLSLEAESNGRAVRA